MIFMLHSGFATSSTVDTSLPALSTPEASKAFALPTWRASPNAISSLESECGLVHFAVLVGEMIDLAGPEVVRVNLSARQAKALGLLMSGTSGPHGITSSASASLQSVLGEQVASKDANAWIDLVQDDMEALGYACGAVPFPSAGVGAPHIRDRLYWVADSDKRAGRQGRAVNRRRHPRSDAVTRAGLGGNGMPCELADSDGGYAGAEREQRSGEHRQQQAHGSAGILADADECSNERGITQSGKRAMAQEHDGVLTGFTQPGPTNGFWRSADWLGCTDAKWRPVRPSTFPLAHGAPARMGRLRAYGNAINAEAARVFIESVMA